MVPVVRCSYRVANVVGVAAKEGKHVPPTQTVAIHRRRGLGIHSASSKLVPK